jgi:hypothetical protein
MMMVMASPTTLMRILYVPMMVKDVVTVVVGLVLVEETAPEQAIVFLILLPAKNPQEKLKALISSG